MWFYQNRLFFTFNPPCKKLVGKIENTYGKHVPFTEKVEYWHTMKQIMKSYCLSSRKSKDSAHSRTTRPQVDYGHVPFDVTPCLVQTWDPERPRPCKLCKISTRPAHCDSQSTSWLQNLGRGTEEQPSNAVLLAGTKKFKTDLGMMVEWIIDP